jgi:cobalt-zinc-cadmium resistance protein CzcA
MNKIVEFALSKRIFFIFISLILLVMGIKSYQNLPVDAFPDIAPIQVKIIIKSSGMTPKEIESQIVTPIEMSVVGIPNESMIRSISKYGICDITIDFKDGTDIYWARQQVSEKLANIADLLPKNISGGLAPISTPLSDILMFTIESDVLSLEEKRTILDWIIAPKIRSISGVAEVNSLGGKVKTYEIIPDVSKMSSLKVSLEDITKALKNNNQNNGAGRVVQGVESILLRTIGRLNNLEDIKTLPIAKRAGKIIDIEDIAVVRFGHLTRAGFVSKNGKSEAVEGLVLGAKGVNVGKVLEEVKKELKTLESMLPNETKIDIFYDRTVLINLATNKIKQSFIEAIILIMIILLLMLGNFSSALSVALILPFSLLMSFIAMELFGLTANLMSLGGLAIAIGILVDCAIVVVEHITTQLGDEKYKNQSKLHIIYESTVQMAPSVITGVLIIIIVFMPLLFLEGLEGKLFKPVALSIIFALSSSLILSFTLIPVLSSYILKKKVSKDSLLILFLIKKYRPILNGSIKYSKTIIFSILLLFVISIYFASKTGKSFMPTMNEGNVIIGIEMAPSISLEESLKLNLKIQQNLMQNVPEIKDIIARSGSDELGLDPMGLNDTDVFLVMQDKDSWRNPSEKFVIDEIRKVLDEFVGIEYSFTQPIQMRVSEMISGSRGDVTVNIFGSNDNNLDNIAIKIKSIIEQIKGSSDVYKRVNDGVEYLELEFNKKAMANYGVTVKEVNEFLKVMITGISFGTVQEEMRRINIVVKGDKKVQNSIDKIKNLYYPLSNRESIPLTILVDFKFNIGPVQIVHENGYKKTIVQTNVIDRGLVSFVNEVKNKIASEIKLPSGYYISFGGEFKNQQRATKRLSLIIPLALLLIMILLFISFGSFIQTIIVLINIPLALIGGFIGLYFSGEYMSVPASVGFIALFGIAVLNGVVLINYFNYLIGCGISIKEAVVEGSIKRLRPILMTASITAFGLLPLLFITGPGSQIQRPLAIVVISGLISSTILTLIVLPILYLKFSNKKLDYFLNKIRFQR